MSSARLEAEFDDCLSRLRQQIGEPCPPGIGLVQAKVDGWCWQPAAHGVLMLVIGEFAGDDQLVDLAAFRMSNPSEVYLRTGEVSWLGLDNFHAARLMQTPLRVHATVDRYVRAGGDGVFPLDGDFAPLLDIAELRFDDADFGRLVRATLSRRPAHLPRFKVQRAAA